MSPCKQNRGVNVLGFLVVKDWLANFGSPGWDPKFPPKKRYRYIYKGGFAAHNYRGCIIRIIGKSRLYMRQYCQRVRLKESLHEEKDNTGIRCNKPQQQKVSPGRRSRTAVAASSSTAPAATAEIHDMYIHNTYSYLVQQRAV